MARDKSGFMSVNVGDASDPSSPNYGLLEQAGAYRGKAAEIEGQSTAATLEFLGKAGATAYQTYQYTQAADEARRMLNRTAAPDQGWMGEAASAALTLKPREQELLALKNKGEFDDAAKRELEQIQNAMKENVISPARAQSEMAAILRRRIAENPGAASSIRAAFEQYSGRGDYDIQEYRRALDLGPSEAAAKAAQAKQDKFFEGEAKDVLVPIGDGGFRGVMPDEIKQLYATNNFASPVGVAYLQHKRNQALEQEKKSLETTAAINKERGTSNASPNIQRTDLDLEKDLTKVYGMLATMQPMLSQNNATMMGEVSALRNIVEASFAKAIATANGHREEALKSGAVWAGAAAKEHQDYIEKLEKRRKTFLETVMEGPKSMMDARKILAETNNATMQEMSARVKFLEPLLKFTSDQEKTLLLSEAGRQQILSGKHPQFKEGGQVYLIARAIDDEVRAITTQNAGMRTQAQSSAAALEQSMDAYRKVMSAATPEKAKQEIAHINERDRALLASTANGVAANVLKQVAQGTDAEGKPYVPSNEHVNNLFVSADNFDDSKERLTSLDSALKSGNLKSAMGDRYEPYLQSVVGRSSTWLFGEGSAYLPSRVRSLMLSGTELEMKDGRISLKTMADGNVQNRVRLSNDLDKVNTLISIQSQALGRPAEEVAQQFMERVKGMKAGEFNTMSAANAQANEQLLKLLPSLPEPVRKAYEEWRNSVGVVKENKEQRENNFLNIRVPGKDDFQGFETKAAAVVAYNRQLDRYAQGKTDGVKRTTVDDIIRLWSNEKEKGSMSHKGYLDVLKKRGGLEPSTIIDTPEKRAQLIYAMQFAEVGAARMSLEEIRNTLGAP